MINLRKKIFLILLGIFLGLLAIELILRIGAMAFYAQQEYYNRLSLKKENTARIMCAGDSLTALGGKYSYPRQLEQALKTKKQEINFSVINKGRPFATSNELLNNLESDLNKYQPNIVVVMVGYNDCLPFFKNRASQSSKLVKFLSNLKTYNLFEIIRYDFQKNNKISSVQKNIFYQIFIIIKFEISNLLHLHQSAADNFQCDLQASENYQKIKEILKGKNIKLVAMQYPTLNVDSLKSALNDNSVIFADNGFFTDLAKDNYNKFFVDNYGRTFGHLTTHGYGILSEHLADTVIENFYK